MQLIQRSILAFCSALLFLSESAAIFLNRNKNEKLEYCMKVIDDFFNETSFQLTSQSGAPTDYFFIPDQDLMRLFYSEPVEFNKPTATQQRDSNEHVFSKKVELDFDNLQIQFRVNHIKEGSGYTHLTHQPGDNQNIPPSGTFKIACATNDCKKKFGEIGYCETGHVLTSLRHHTGPFISGSFLQPIVVRLPWNKNYTVFDAQQTLRSVVFDKPETVPNEWEATEVTLTKPFLRKPRITFVTKDQISISAQLPQRIKKERWFHQDERTQEYFQAAVDFFTIGKAMGNDRLFFHKTSEEFLPADAKNLFQMDEKNDQLSTKLLSASHKAIVRRDSTAASDAFSFYNK